MRIQIYCFLCSNKTPCFLTSSKMEHPQSSRAGSTEWPSRTPHTDPAVPACQRSHTPAQSCSSSSYGVGIPRQTYHYPHPPPQPNPLYPHLTETSLMTDLNKIIHNVHIHCTRDNYRMFSCLRKVQVVAIADFMKLLYL